MKNIWEEGRFGHIVEVLGDCVRNFDTFEWRSEVIKHLKETQSGVYSGIYKAD